jgi:hypothetical protein
LVRIVGRFTLLPLSKSQQIYICIASNHRTIDDLAVARINGKAGLKVALIDCARSITGKGARSSRQRFGQKTWRTVNHILRHQDITALECQLELSNGSDLSTEI